MTAPWDADALWLKAKLFINHAMDDEVARTEEERELWASLALELLAKAALARASPLLIAVPTEEGQNVLIAAGLVQGEGTFKSISAHTLFTRCGRAFKPFSEKEANQIARNRNDYIHAASADFSPIPPTAWWPKFWAQAHVLVNACDRNLTQFVGDSRVAQVERALEQNHRNLQERLQMLIDRAQQRLARYLAGEMRAGELEEWRRPRDLTAGLGYGVAHRCPACESEDGLLEGDEVLNREIRSVQISESDFEVEVFLDIGVDHFSCDNCHLVLDSFELIEAAGLPQSIEAEGQEEDFWEPDYGND